MSGLETAEKFLKLVRELGLVAILAGVLVFLGPELPRLGAQLKRASVSEVNLGVLKLKVEQATVALESALEKSSSRTGPEDAQVPEELQPVAAALSSLRDVSAAADAGAANPGPVVAERSFWVYLGARREGAWLTQQFDLRAVPAADAVIRPTLDVFGRERAPLLASGQWTKGATVGVLQAGQPARVVRTERIPGTNARELWWAEVVPQ